MALEAITMVQPSIIAETPERLTARLDPFKEMDILVLHLDIMSQPFVPASSLDFREVYGMLASFSGKTPDKPKYSAHLMTQNPYYWLREIPQDLRKRLVSIVPHCEVISFQLEDVSQYCRDNGIRFGLAVKKETPAEIAMEKIYKYHAEEVLVMTVVIGAEGQGLDAKPLEKIKYFRDHRYKGLVVVDGGVNDKDNVIGPVKSQQPDAVVSGGFVNRAENKYQAALSLQKKLLGRL